MIFFFFIIPLRCRTVALETGMQNTQLCTTIVQLSFTPEQLALMFTFPLIYSIFQLAFAVIFVGGKTSIFYYTKSFIINIFYSWVPRDNKNGQFGIQKIQ